MPEEVSNTPSPRSERRKRAAQDRITDDLELGVERTVEGPHKVLNKVDFKWMENRTAIAGALGGLVAGFFLGAAMTRAMK